MFWGSLVLVMMREFFLDEFWANTKFAAIYRWIAQCSHRFIAVGIDMNNLVFPPHDN